MSNRYRAANPSRGSVPRPEPDPRLDLSFVPSYRGCLGERKLMFRVVDYVHPETGKAVLNALSTAPFFRPEMINARSDRVSPRGTPTWRPARSEPRKRGIVASDAVDRMFDGTSIPSQPVRQFTGMSHIDRQRAERAADLERRFEALRAAAH